MLDPDLTKQLESIGLSADNARMVALLPLVQVAWADGAVQAEERTLILDIAKKRGLVTESGAPVLEKWLTSEPSRFVHVTGRKIIAGLVARKKEELPNLEGASPAEVVAWCEGVAQAAGGFLGFGNKVAGTEKTAIAEIADALRVKDAKSWDVVKVELS